MHVKTPIQTIRLRARVRALALSPDGSRLYSASGDKTVKAWDTATGQCVATYEGHRDWVRALAISPDGSPLYSGSDDRTVKVWDTAQ